MRPANGEIYEPSISRKQCVVICALLTCFMSAEGYDMQVLGYAAPLILRSMAIDKSSLGLVFGAAMAGFMVGALALAPLGDRIGRRPVVIGGLTTFGAFTLASALIPSFYGLFVCRVLASVGLGAASPAAIALMSDASPFHLRSRYISVLYLGYTVGSGAGGGVAALLLPAYGWRSVFVVGGVFPLLTVCLLFWRLPESPRFGGIRRSSSPAISLPRNRRDGSPRQLLAGGRASVSLLLWTACIGNMMTHHFMTSWLPTVIVASGISLRHAEITLSLLQFAGAAGGLVVGASIDKFGVRAAACAMFAGVPFIVGLGSAAGIGLPALGLAIGTGLCIVGAQTGANSLPGIIYPSGLRATASAWTNGMGRIGAILGPVAGGILLSAGLPRASMFDLAAIPAAIGAASLMILATRPAANRHTLAPPPLSSTLDKGFEM